MNKHRLFSSTLAGATGLCALLLAPPGACGQTGTRPTVRPVANAVAAPVSADNVATPSPDAETGERTPPTDAAAKGDEITETDIDASQSATFNSRDRVAVFTGNVKVIDPRFQLVCDRLTVFLNKPTPAGQNAAATPAPTPAGKPGKGKADAQTATPTGGSGIDHAIAEGHVVIIQKKAPTAPGEEEKLSIGRGQTGTFDNKSGDMVLKGWPSLEQNGSSLIAAAESTVMTIHRDSSLDTSGPSKTKLIQKGKGGSAFDLLPGAPAAPTGAKRQGGGRRGGAAPAATPAASGH